MTLLCRTPATDGQLSSGDPEGTNSCVSYSYSYASGAASHCATHPSGAQIRDWTGDHLGGLELAQCDLAMHDHTTLEFDTKVVSLAEWKSRRAAGQGAVLLGGYKPIAESRFSGQRNFFLNHGIWVPPDNKVMDPLADGRHPTTYKYHGEVYPDSLILAFAAALLVGPTHAKYPVGPDHFEASFITVPATVNPPAIKHKASVSAGQVNFYNVNSANVATLNRVAHTGGFSGYCTGPRLYHWQPKIGRPYIRLIKMLTGVYAGLYINTSNPRVKVTVVP